MWLRAGQCCTGSGCGGRCCFRGSMGKDFETPALAQEKVRTEILALPEDTLICPGHGPLTTVGEERAHNPFFSVLPRFSL